jgi:RNA polymerase sigma-54 factor
LQTRALPADRWYNGVVMRLDVSQHLRLQQQMKLAPRLIQAMEILQLPMLALQERIETELVSNPVLEQRLGAPEVEEDVQAPPAEDTRDRGEQALVIREGNNRDDFERLADFSAEYPESIAPDAPVSRPPPAGDRDRKLDAMANAPAHDENLNEYLAGQWAFVEATQPVHDAGELIIAYIEADGYLRTTLEELIGKTDPPTPLEALTAALPLVQALDPAGVGARNLSECLLLQLAIEQATGRDVALEIELVRSFLRDIELNRLPQVARKTGKTIEQVKAALENLSHLNPRPGALVGTTIVPIVLPDLIVEIGDDGEPVVRMADGNTPRLSVSKDYRKMADDRSTDRAARTFLRRNMQSARWLIDAIQQRRYTVQRVAEEVFQVQKEFLEHGEQALHPLPMATVARKVNVHVATVSRAVAGKYVQTPRGIFPLRMFFSGGKTSAGGEDMAWDALKVKLKEVIDAEDKNDPLNDDELAAEMTRHGCVIARRTVTKYRKLLDIPPARKRRLY